MPARDAHLQHKYVLAVDLGSGGPKVGVVEDTGRVVGSAVERNAIHFVPGGGAEQDPREWWQTVVRGAKKALAAANVPRDSIVAVGCTSQWSVTVAVDAGGEPLMNALGWMDTRGAPYGRAIARGFPSVQGYGVAKLIRWIRLAGLPPTQSGVDALSHMLFIKHERPEIYQRTHKFLEPMDFINLRLTGKFAASQCTAMPMILTDNRTTECRAYHPWLLKVSGIDRAKLPELLPNDGIVGTLAPLVAEELGLSPATAVIVGAGDNHTSAIGAGAVRDYEGVAVFGTSGFLSCHVPFKRTDLLHLLTTVPSTLRGRYLVLAELGGNGKVLDAYLTHQVYSGDGLAPAQVPPEAYECLDRVAEQAPAGSDGLLFLPWFNGTLCPEEDAAMRGGFVNLSLRTTRAHMTRAVLEGICMNWRWLLGHVQKFMARRFEYLRLAGGGAKSNTWAQILADVTGLPIHQQADPRNGNVLGIAFLAFNRLGLLALDDVPRRVAIAKVYEPQDQNHLVYDKLFAQFMACKKRLKPVFHAINRT